jgi:hypothetical protein
MKSIKSNLFVFVLFIQCQGNVDKEAIETIVVPHEWKYGEGTNIGDWIDFKTGYYTIKRDTIFRNDSAVAVISYFDGGRLGDDVEMEITLTKNSSKGIYYSK